MPNLRTGTAKTIHGLQASPPLGYVRIGDENPGGYGPGQASDDAAGGLASLALFDLGEGFLQFFVEALDHAAEDLVVLLELGVIVGIAQGGDLELELGALVLEHFALGGEGVDFFTEPVEAALGLPEFSLEVLVVGFGRGVFGEVMVLADDGLQSVALGGCEAELGADVGKGCVELAGFGGGLLGDGFGGG